MFPPAHPGVAYLLYAGYTRLSGDDVPSGPATVSLVVGSLVPDLFDQSLYHLAGAPTTRTVGHSLVVAVALSGLVAAWVRWSEIDTRVATAFAVGYGSHLFADAVWPLLLWQPAELRYLGWPLTWQPPYEGTFALASVGPVTLTTLWVELVLLGLAIVVWWHDGRPCRPETVQWRNR